MRDYRSLIMLADRHDWLNSFSGELAVTLAIEHAIGLAPPARAVWLRTLLAEFGRIHPHLSYLSHICSNSTASRLWEVVESLRSALLEWSGNRVHPMLNRVGGLAFDIPQQWVTIITSVLRTIDALTDELRLELDAHGTRFRGLAVTSADICMQFGLSGPAARAAGLNLDVRLSGGLAYRDVLITASGRCGGDAHARFETLLDEVCASRQILERCLEGLALRTPTFSNVSALEVLLVGARENQIADVVASVGYGIGDLDK